MKIDFNEQLTTKTDQELIDIYINHDDFQENFVTAAVEELNKRNVSIEHFKQEGRRREKLKLNNKKKAYKGIRFI